MNNRLSEIASMKREIAELRAMIEKSSAKTKATTPKVTQELLLAVISHANSDVKGADGNYTSYVGKFYIAGAIKKYNNTNPHVKTSSSDIAGFSEKIVLQAAKEYGLI